MKQYTVIVYDDMYDEILRGDAFYNKVVTHAVTLTQLIGFGSSYAIEES